AILIVLIPIRYVFFSPKEIEAAWFDDAWAYRKKLVIDDSGGSGATDKRVKFDINTSDSVDPETANFNTTDSTFTENMAKRTAPGPFDTAPIIQGSSADNTYDYLSTTRGTQVSGNFYTKIDSAQGSISLWLTPEWDGNDGYFHTIFKDSSSQIILQKNTSGNLWLQVGGQNIVVDVSSWTAGTTYHIVARWDVVNTLDGTNYLSLSIDDSHTFGVTSTPNNNAPGINLRIGQETLYPANAIIEGLTIYRRPLYGGADGYGIDVGNEDEIEQIYDATPANATDPTLITGSWDVVFALPTDQSAGTLGTTGEAWSHPHSSNELYTSTSNTGGFMLNGTYTTDDWSDEGTPSSVAALADSEKIFAGGYKTTSDAADEGIEYDSWSVTSGDDFVIRALAHSDEDCVPKISVTGADDGVIANATMSGTIVTGTHDGGDNQSILTDSGASWTDDEWIGYTVYNTTKSESATITDNDSTTITGTLSGSADWDDGNAYRIGTNREQPDAFLFTVEADTTESAKIKLTNTASSGTCYWHQVEVLPNEIDKPSLETGSGNPWIPDGWSNSSNPLGSGEGIQETTIVHSGASSLKFAITSSPSIQKGIIQSSAISDNGVGGYTAFGAWMYESTGNIQSSISGNDYQYHHNASNGPTIQPASSGSWIHKSRIGRRYDTGASWLRAIKDWDDGDVTGYFDDIYAYHLDAVTLTVTPASEANSLESSGLRVDGRDTLTQTISNLTTTKGTIKFDYTPRHDAADQLAFLESTDVYIGEWYGDADDYIQLYWSAANTVTLAYSINGTTGSDTWNASVNIDAGTTYTFTVAYDLDNDSLTLDVDSGSGTSIAYNLYTLDSSTNVSAGTSIAIASDGYPRIAYFDEGNDNLLFIQCTAVDCSTKNTTTVDSGGDVGRKAVMVLGSDQFARIAYYDATNGYVKFVQCTNADCSTKNTNNVEDVGTSWDTGNWRESIGISLGTDGFARLAYRDTNSSLSLHYAVCNDAACSSPTTSTVDDPSQKTGAYASLALDGSDNAYITYHQGSNNSPRLRLARYVASGGTGCTGTSAWTCTTISTDPAGWFTNVQLGSDGYPRIFHSFTWRGTPTDDLVYVKCNDADCTSYTNNAAYVPVDQAMVVNGFYLEGNDIPRTVVYENDSNADNLPEDLTFVYCEDAECSSSTTQTLDSTGDVGWGNSFAHGSDGYDYISYVDETNNYLKMARVLVSGGNAITINSIPAAFGTAPSTAHWGKRNSGSDDRQADATYAQSTVSDPVKMQADCGDIRVTDQNGKVLDYYLDTATGDCNSETTDLWVLVPTVNADDDTALYMYYGNSSAENASVGSQFSESAYSPGSSVTVGSEEKGPTPVLYYKFDEGVD
ncbi:MAG: DUF2341 domain-containing protein, partial [Candidatus Thorarchaeota archaeon]